MVCTNWNGKYKHVTYELEVVIYFETWLLCVLSVKDLSDLSVETFSYATLLGQELKVQCLYVTSVTFLSESECLACFS